MRYKIRQLQTDQKWPHVAKKNLEGSMLLKKSYKAAGLVVAATAAAATTRPRCQVVPRVFIWKRDLEKVRFVAGVLIGGFGKLELTGGQTKNLKSDPA